MTDDHWRGDPAKIQARLAELGHEKARTHAYYATTERLRKQVKALCYIGSRNDGKTQGDAEQYALLHPDYHEACERAESAQEAAGVAAVDYEAAMAWMEMWRSQEATKRAEMTMR